MNADDLARKFDARVAAAAKEKGRQADLGVGKVDERSADIEHCKNALEREVLPFLVELRDKFPDGQFTFSHQVERNDSRPVGVSFTIGNGGPTNITTAFGNVVVTRVGASGTSKGVPYVFAPDADPFISNSGDLTREKIGRLVELLLDYS
jgi:hypothetical protein